jgi:hypothetical protein
MILFGLLITALVAARMISVKVGARTLDAASISLSSAAFLCASLWALFPVFGFGAVSAPAIAAGVLKGICVYWCVKLGAEVAKSMNSASVFASFIALGIGAPINSELLGEGLSMAQLSSCIGLGVLGVAFMLKGAAVELSRSDMRKFLLLVATFAANMCLDRFALSRTDWYSHALVSNTVFFIVSLSSAGFAPLAELARPTMLGIGLIYTACDFTILYGYANVTGVSMGGVFQRLANPIVMIMSAYIWHERTPAEQLVFGGLAFLLVLPLLLF